MTSELVPMNPAERCGKCDGSLSPTYHRACSYSSREHLHLRCRCGYEELRGPVDKEEPKFSVVVPKGEEDDPDVRARLEETRERLRSEAGS